MTGDPSGGARAIEAADNVQWSGTRGRSNKTRKKQRRRTAVP